MNLGLGGWSQGGKFRCETLTQVMVHSDVRRRVVNSAMTISTSYVGADLPARCNLPRNAAFHVKGLIGAAQIVRAAKQLRSCGHIAEWPSDGNVKRMPCRRDFLSSRPIA